jgi:hypothetical protein
MSVVKVIITPQENTAAGTNIGATGRVAITMTKDGWPVTHITNDIIQFASPVVIEYTNGVLKSDFYMPTDDTHLMYWHFMFINSDGSTYSTYRRLPNSWATSTINFSQLTVKGAL